MWPLNLLPWPLFVAAWTVILLATVFGLTGPRLLWEVYDRARGAPGADRAVRVAAAEVAVDLLDAGRGLPVRRLVRPGRTAAEVWRAVRYLGDREWVGVSRRRDRVWLLSPVVERLGKALGARRRRILAQFTELNRRRGAPGFDCGQRESASAATLVPQCRGLFES